MISVLLVVQWGRRYQRRKHNSMCNHRTWWVKWKRLGCLGDMYQGIIFWVGVPLSEEVILMLKIEK